MIHLGLWTLGFKVDLYVYQKKTQSQKTKKTSNKPCHFKQKPRLGDLVSKVDLLGADQQLALIVFPFQKHLKGWKKPCTWSAWFVSLVQARTWTAESCCICWLCNLTLEVCSLWWGSLGRLQGRNRTVGQIAGCAVPSLEFNSVLFRSCLCMVLPPNQGGGIDTARQQHQESCERFNRSLMPRQEHTPDTEGEKYLGKSTV